MLFVVKDTQGQEVMGRNETKEQGWSHHLGSPGQNKQLFFDVSFSYGFIWKVFTEHLLYTRHHVKCYRPKIEQKQAYRDIFFVDFLLGMGEHICFKKAQKYYEIKIGDVSGAHDR